METVYIITIGAAALLVGFLIGLLSGIWLTSALDSYNELEKTHEEI